MKKKQRNFVSVAEIRENMVQQQVVQEELAGLTSLQLVMVVRFRVQHRLLSQLLTLLVILMRFLLLLLMSLTAKELITSHQQQSLRDASLLLRFFLAGSAIFVELRNMISFLKIAESISNLLRRQSVFLSR